MLVSLQTNALVMAGMSEKVSDGAFGRLLRFWRQLRKRSQEDVALEIDSSIRHISFLENGKSLPSREITLRLAAYFGLSGRETNNLLVAAGYTPMAIGALNPRETEILDQSLVATLRGFDPYPSAIVDRAGEVKMINRGWVEILGKRMAPAGATGEFNLMDVFFAEDGIRQYMDNWQDNICALLVTIQQDVLVYQDPTAIANLQRYLKDPGLPLDWQVRGANLLTLSGMFLQLSLPGDETRNYIVVINTVGSERFIPDPMLMIFSVFPQDDEVADAWQARLAGKTFEHPLLHY